MSLTLTSKFLELTGNDGGRVVVMKDAIVAIEEVGSGAFLYLRGAARLEVKETIAQIFDQMAKT